MAAQKDNAQTVPNFFAQAAQTQVAYAQTLQDEWTKLAGMQSAFFVNQMEVANQLARNAWSHNQDVMTEVNRVGRDMVARTITAATTPIV